MMFSEKAVLAVTLSNDKDEILGHAAFFDYPNVEGVDQAAWEKWLNETYDLPQCNALNTLFLHYFVAKPEYSHGCAAEIMVGELSRSRAARSERPAARLTRKNTTNAIKNLIPKIAW